LELNEVNIPSCVYVA